MCRLSRYPWSLNLLEPKGLQWDSCSFQRSTASYPRLTHAPRLSHSRRNRQPASHSFRLPSLISRSAGPLHNVSKSNQLLIVICTTLCRLTSMFPVPCNRTLSRHTNQPSFILPTLAVSVAIKSAIRYYWGTRQAMYCDVTAATSHYHCCHGKATKYHIF